MWSAGRVAPAPASVSDGEKPADISAPAQPAKGASRVPAGVTLVVGLGAIGLYFLLPNAAQDLMYLGIGAAATAVLFVAVRIRKPPECTGWQYLGVGNACFVLGDGVYMYYDLVLHREVPFPSVADAIYLVGYPFLFAGVVRVSRLRGRPGSRETRADAAILSVGALTLSWQFLMGSYAHDGSLGQFGRIVTLAYPVMDIAVLFIIVIALMTAIARRSSDKILAVSILSMLVADFIYDFLVLHSAITGDAHPIDALFLLAYVLLAVAAIHPTASDLPVERPDARTNRAWLPLVAVATFVSPALLLASTVFGTSDYAVVMAITSIAIIVLGILRVTWLFGRLHDQASQLQRRGESLHAALVAQHDLEAELRHEAFHDGLTGLANRALLHDRVEHALAVATRRQGSVAVCFCDLDHLKIVNDGLSRRAGDDLLQITGNRLLSIVRPGDTVARVGGDEFAVLLDNVESVGAAEALAERIVSALHQPVTIDGQELCPSASVGLAFADVGTAAETLLEQGDAAMCAAKAAGRDRFAVFQTDMRAAIVDRTTLINSFQPALLRGEFFLEYQPQHRVSDGSLEGFEALVRWQHPELGRVEPDRFIALAEETGFIVPLGRWVLEHACVQAAGWPTRPGPPLSLAVNLSGRQLQDPKLLQDVRTALSFSGLHPAQLILEITETVLMKDPPRAAELLARFKALGIRLAIDDFGTGYSALSQLRQFPMDILKIDKSFIDRIGDDDALANAFVATILRLAKDLDMKTTAEGVETQSQFDVLAALKCHSIQGFLRSRPLSNDAARAYISGSLTEQFDAIR